MAPARAETEAPFRRSTHCVALEQLGLNAVDWRKVDRYLDVTKSALLFGGRVLLVEGIAEALLFPVIAREYVLKGRHGDLQRFRSSVFVPIDSVDFEPYVRLLLTAVCGTRVADRLVVVTDGDGGGPGGLKPPGELRKEKLDAIALELQALEIFEAVTNTYSLEVEVVAAGNAALLKTVYLELRPNSEEKWDTAVAETGDAQAKAVRDLFKSTRKGDFAQILAERITEGEAFTTPSYIVAAIEALVR